MEYRTSKEDYLRRINNMNKNYFSKFWSTLLALTLLVSLVTTPLSMNVYAENEFGDDGDVEKVVVPEVTEESDPNNVYGEEGGNEVQPEPVADEPESLEVQPEPALEQPEPVVEQRELLLEAEVVEFENDLVRETVKRELGIESDDVTVSDMENLKEFYISLWDYDGHKISLKGLEHAVNLEFLMVMNVDIEDTWVLENLTKLKLINLYNTNIEDISFIKDLTQLKALNLSSTSVSDISALEKLTNLELLNLDFTNVSDISVLKNLKKLIGLGLGAPNVTDISVLEHLQELNEVALYETKITDIKVLRKLPKLSNAVLDLIPVEAYDFETLDLLLEKGAIIGWDAGQWYLSQLEDLFPEEEGFIVNEEKSQIIANVNDKYYDLSANQVDALKENNLTIVLDKEGVTTSIPAFVFTDYGPVRITIEKLDKVANSYSDVYKFTIKQGNETITAFKENPISLTFKVDAEGVNNVNNLKVFYLNESTDNWEKIGGTYDAETGTVTAETDHFSTFAVFEADEIDSDNNVVEDNELSELEETKKPVEEEPKDTGNTNVDPQVTIDDDSRRTNINDDNASADEGAGAVLPNTATNMYSFMFVGLAFLLAGIATFAMRRLSGKKA